MIYLQLPTQGTGEALYLAHLAVYACNCVPQASIENYVARTISARLQCQGSDTLKVHRHLPNHDRKISTQLQEVEK